MKLRKNELKKLIKECLIELLSEGLGAVDFNSAVSQQTEQFQQRNYNTNQLQQNNNYQKFLEEVAYGARPNSPDVPQYQYQHKFPPPPPIQQQRLSPPVAHQNNLSNVNMFEEMILTAQPGTDQTLGGMSEEDMYRWTNAGMNYK
jgi:hypothetical protein